MKDLVLIISFIRIIIITSALAQSIEENDFRSLPVVQWKIKTEKPVVSSPIIDNNVIYTGSLDSNLYALDLETGT